MKNCKMFSGLVLLIIGFVLVSGCFNSPTSTNDIKNNAINNSIVKSYNISRSVWVETIKSPGGLFWTDAYQTMVVGNIHGAHGTMHEWLVTFDVVSVSASDGPFLATSGSVNVKRIDVVNNNSYSQTPYAIFAYPTHGVDDPFFEKLKQANNTLSSVAINEINNYSQFGLDSRQFEKSLNYTGWGDTGKQWPIFNGYGKINCGYISYWQLLMEPGETRELDITSTLNWLWGNNQAKMHLKITAPPDPHGMSEYERKAYNMTSSVLPSSKITANNQTYITPVAIQYNTNNLSVEVKYK